MSFATTNAAMTTAEQPMFAVPTPRPRSGRRFLVWTIGLVVIGGMLISVLLPSLCRAREPANRIKCASNLRQIGQAIALYAHDNGGQYPPSLDVLLKQGDLSAEVMVCPSSNDVPASAADTAGAASELAAAENNEPGHDHCLSYVYTGRGLTVATASAASIVAYEPLDNHNGSGTNVLFGDNHVEWIDKKSWPSVANAAGVAAVPSLTTRP